MSNKITLSNIEDIIDNHLEAERGFVFVCDETISNYIMDYLDNGYGIEEEYPEGAEENIDEYYVTVDFYKGEPKLYCGNARTNSGRYKYSDINNCDYFIDDETDMCDITADKMLKGENCTWSWFEIVPEEDEDCDECDCDYDCDNCEFNEDEDPTIDEIIDEYVNLLEEVAPCPDCMKRVLEMFYDEVTEMIED